ncbi:MAG: hypothetical protein IT488_01105 [Gammaproteobacteria bacterium]|nr:hypothetical protein [Gammaproteobacteria bacterium]
MFALGVLPAVLAVFMLRGGPLEGVEPQPVSTTQELMPAAAQVAFEPSATGFVVRGNGFAARLKPVEARFRLRDAAGEYSQTGFRLLGANGDSAGTGVDLLPGRSHYYLGNDPADWRVNVPHYARVNYASVYPGIDMAWHGDQGGLEFDFIVSPGADPASIRLSLDANRPARIDSAGDLLLATATGELRLRRPIAYQESTGRGQRVDAAFELDGTGRELRFRLGEYDTSRRLIIDPVIAYADYLGGGSDDSGLALAVDAAGNRYVAGATESVDFADEAKPVNTGRDIFVAKLAPDGTRLYVTFITGNGADQANAITIDSGGEAYITGDTSSGNLAASGGAVQPGYGGDGDAFVARLATDGALEYLSYLGGAALDSGRAIALGAGGDMIVGGSTLSTNFPIQTVVQPTIGGQGDGFITRINATGTALVYSTYHGGIGPENVAALAVDETDAVYFGGTTGSDNFPTAGGPDGPYQDSFQGGNSDGYVAKLSPDGSSLVYSTYLGGSGIDGVLALAVDDDHITYVTGFSSSSFNFPTTDGTPLYAGGAFDAFLTRLIPSGAVPNYSTFLGGSGEDQGLAVTLSDSDPLQVVVAGVTESDDLSLIQPFQVERLGGADGFVTMVQFSPTAVSPIFSTYLGGTGDDAITAARAESAQITHVAGTGGANLPVVPLQGGNAGGVDAFVMRLERDLSQALPDLAVSVDADPTPVSRRNNLEFTVRVDNSGGGAASGVLLRINGTNFSSLSSPTTSCQASTGISLLCDAGSINANGFGSFDVVAASDQIGDVTLTATLLRADQSGIDPEDKSATIERLVVDDSDQSAAISWELLVLVWAVFLLLLLRRRELRD